MAEIVLEPLPFEEAIKYFGDKIPLIPEEFAALSRAAKATAFTVGGVARMDLVEGVHGAVLKAIKDGETLADFQGRVNDIFATRGFAAAEEGLGAWRLETIFRTNIQTSYNVGRYEQMVTQKDRFPYWKYDAVNDSNTRPEHGALDGKIFPADDPFWDTWYPPNGFRCRCSVVSLSERQIKKRGLKVETENPTGNLIEPTDSETGKKMPARLLIPDPGFDNNPGKAIHGGIV